MQEWGGGAKEDITQILVIKYGNKGFEFKFLDDNIVLFHCGHLPTNYA